MEGGMVWGAVGGGQVGSGKWEVGREGRKACDHEAMMMMITSHVARMHMCNDYATQNQCNHEALSQFVLRLRGQRRVCN